MRSCSADGIQFQFIPPRTPYFGGIWEAAVKSLKNQLRRTVGNANLTAEQMSTFLAQAEACSNSRPLTPISNDPDDLDRDLDVLTPAHFLVHRPLIAIPEPLYEEIATNRMSQWQMIQEYLRRLWKRWSTEYLSGLQQRTRWTRERDNIRIGTMVLVTTFLRRSGALAESSRSSPATTGMFVSSSFAHRTASTREPSLGSAFCRSTTISSQLRTHSSSCRSWFQKRTLCWM